MEEYEISLITRKILIGLIIFIASLLAILLITYPIFPLPRGTRVNKNIYSYYRNFFGIYYITVEDPIALFNIGEWGYLKDVDYPTFEILGESWSKDAKHVWFGNYLVKTADAESFHLNKSGIPVDKDNVFIVKHLFSVDNPVIVYPSFSGIDPATAEYFICGRDYMHKEWIRDKENVYYKDCKVNVNRNSFKSLNEYFFIDKNHIYATHINDSINEREFITVDSIQYPLDTLCHDSKYLRNGNTIIYLDKILVENTEIETLRKVGEEKYIINDMLFVAGKQILKDTVNVNEAKFYIDGRLIVDSKGVYFDRNHLVGIDASTFRKVDRLTFEDKNYIYTIKDQLWKETYPFEKHVKSE
jgi:outer membrane protein assembly factor BamB